MPRVVSGYRAAVATSQGTARYLNDRHRDLQAYPFPWSENRALSEVSSCGRFTLKSMAGQVNEHVFQCRFADAHRIDLTGESFDQFGDELVGPRLFETNDGIEQRRVEAEPGANPFLQ